MSSLWLTAQKYSRLLQSKQWGVDRWCQICNENPHQMTGLSTLPCWKRGTKVAGSVKEKSCSRFLSFMWHCPSVLLRACNDYFISKLSLFLPLHIEGQEGGSPNTPPWMWHFPQMLANVDLAEYKCVLYKSVCVFVRNQCFVALCNWWGVLLNYYHVPKSAWTPSWPHLGSNHHNIKLASLAKQFTRHSWCFFKVFCTMRSEAWCHSAVMSHGVGSQFPPDRWIFNTKWCERPQSLITSYSCRADELQCW